MPSKKNFNAISQCQQTLEKSGTHSFFQAPSHIYLMTKNLVQIQTSSALHLPLFYWSLLFRRLAALSLLNLLSFILPLQFACFSFSELYLNSSSYFCITFISLLTGISLYLFHLFLYSTKSFKFNSIFENQFSYINELKNGA